MMVGFVLGKGWLMLHLSVQVESLWTVNACQSQSWGGSWRVDKSMASLFFHPVNSPIASGGGMELELAAPGLAAVGQWGRPLGAFWGMWANAAGMRLVLTFAQPTQRQPNTGQKTLPAALSAAPGTVHGSSPLPPSRTKVLPDLRRGRWLGVGNRKGYGLHST